MRRARKRRLAGDHAAAMDFDGEAVPRREERGFAQRQAPQVRHDPRIVDHRRLAFRAAQPRSVVLGSVSGE